MYSVQHNRDRDGRIIARFDATSASQFRNGLAGNCSAAQTFFSALSLQRELLLQIKRYGVYAFRV